MNFPHQGFQNLEHEEDRQTDAQTHKHRQADRHTHTDRCNQTHYHAAFVGGNENLA